MALEKTDTTSQFLHLLERETDKETRDYFYTLLTKKSEEPLNVEIKYFEEENHRSVPLRAFYEGFMFLNKEN